MDLTQRRESFDQANYDWLGSEHGTTTGRPVTIDESTLTEETHYPDGYLASGFALGETGDGLYGPYDGEASDGRETFVGFLLEPVKVTSGSNPIGTIVEHVIVINDNLPFPLDADGIADCAGRVLVRGGGS